MKEKKVILTIEETSTGYSGYIEETDNVIAYAGENLTEVVNNLKEGFLFFCEDVPEAGKWNINFFVKIIPKSPELNTNILTRNWILEQIKIGNKTITRKNLSMYTDAYFVPAPNGKHYLVQISEIQ